MRRYWLRLLAGAGVPAALVAILVPSVVRAEGTLTLDPARGRCGSTVRAEGAGFPPGAAVRLLAWVGHQAFEVAQATADGDGAFRATIERLSPPGCTDGAQYRITATTAAGRGGEPGSGMSAEAHFTVSSGGSPPSPGRGAEDDVPTLTPAPDNSRSALATPTRAAGVETPAPPGSEAPKVGEDEPGTRRLRLALGLFLGGTLVVVAMVPVFLRRNR